MLVGIIGLLIERLCIKPVKNPTIITLILVTIAVSIILKGSAMFMWGKDPYGMKPFSGNKPLNILGATIMPQALWVIGLTFCTVVLLHLFFQKTLIGKAIRACADNPETAGLMGIDVRKMIMMSFALSAALGAIAGVVVTPITLMEYDRGAMFALKGFAASVLGGLGSFYGAIIAGILLGLIEVFSVAFISSGYKDAVALIIMLLILFGRSKGVFGSISP